MSAFAPLAAILSLVRHLRAALIVLLTMWRAQGDTIRELPRSLSLIAEVLSRFVRSLVVNCAARLADPSPQPSKPLTRALCLHLRNLPRAKSRSAAAQTLALICNPLRAACSGTSAAPTGSGYMAATVTNHFGCAIVASTHAVSCELADCS